MSNIHRGFSELLDPNSGANNMCLRTQTKAPRPVAPEMTRAWHIILLEAFAIVHKILTFYPRRSNKTWKFPTSRTVRIVAFELSYCISIVRARNKRVCTPCQPRGREKTSTISHFGCGIAEKISNWIIPRQECNVLLRLC